MATRPSLMALSTGFTARVSRRLAGQPRLWIVALWALATASRFVKSGVCFDLNYSIFQPDGNLYISLAHDVLAGHPGDSPVVAWTRPLLSILSLPIYLVVGDHGLLVVPALSLLLVGYLLLRVGRDSAAEWVAVMVYAALTFSVTVNRWMVADLTDSPHAALVLVMFVMLVREARIPLLAVVLLLGTLARPAGPIWAALLVAFAWRSWGTRARWLYLLATSALLAFVAAGVSVGSSGGFDRDPVSPVEHILNAPVKVFTVAFVDIAELAVLDRTLLALWLLVTFIAWRMGTNAWTRAYWFTLAASFLLSGWIGVYGVNSRYQLPAIFIGAAVLIRGMAQRYPNSDSAIVQAVGWR